MDRLNSNDDQGVMLRSMRELEGGAGGEISVAFPTIRPAPGAATPAWLVHARKGRLRPPSTAGKVDEGDRSPAVTKVIGLILLPRLMLLSPRCPLLGSTCILWKVVRGFTKKPRVGAMVVLQQTRKARREAGPSRRW